MAKAVNMSRRTFERRFVEATGLGPGKWLVAERVQAAKDLLTSSTASMEEVAATVGFGTAHALRHHFRAQVRLSPTAYRQEFLPVADLRGRQIGASIDGRSPERPLLIERR